MKSISSRMNRQLSGLCLLESDPHQPERLFEHDNPGLRNTSARPIETGGQGATDMQKFGDHSKMASEVALSPLRHPFPAPCDKHILREPRVRIHHLDIAELYLPLRELINQVNQFTIFKCSISSCTPLGKRKTNLPSSEPSKRSPCFPSLAGRH